MTTQERNQMLAGLLEQGVIDESWLLAPCKIPCSKPYKARIAIILHWLAVAVFVLVAALTVALVAYVAINTGEL